MIKLYSNSAIKEDGYFNSLRSDNKSIESDLSSGDLKVKFGFVELTVHNDCINNKIIESAS